MKTFKEQCAQGDVFIRRVDSIPTSAKHKETNGPVVIAHSETGHNHQFTDATGIELYEHEDPFVCYLSIGEPRALEHMRSFDTHAPILFAPGKYEVRRQREHTPEGYKRVED
jgi:hypothetical protein